MKRSVFFLSAAVIIPVILFITVSLIHSENGDAPDGNSGPLVGTDKGLYVWNKGETPKRILPNLNGEIRKIVQVPKGYFFLTEYGIVFSENLSAWEWRNDGLPVKKIKYFENGEKSFSNEIQDLKDLEADPANPDNIITCSKDGIFYSTNFGLNWISLPNPTAVPGSKCVAIYSDPDLKVMVGHPFYGIYQRNVSKKSAWKPAGNGLVKFAGFFHEEVSDIVPVRESNGIAVYAANNFKPVLYRWDSENAEWKEKAVLPENFGFIESLNYRTNAYGSNEIVFVNSSGVKVLDENAGTISNAAFEMRKTEFESNTSARMECFFEKTQDGNTLNLSSLWLLSDAPAGGYTKTAAGKKGIYILPNLLKKSGRLEAFLDTISNNNLNMAVIDMKDDWGNLRFKPDSPILKQKGQYAGTLDLPELIQKMKSRGIYMVARIVLFQDRVLYAWNHNEYAVKDKKSGDAWRGIKTGKDGSEKQILEYWVDPYCEKVWEYNVEIAKEVIAKGFDEVQFDYVRFPTDGDNLENAKFTYRDEGMDKESAIMSFLSYARKNIHAPISIDIYGANGWYRTGARTGQDVELFRRYVDAVCPMFYPSHFEQDFLAGAPAELRPYRIYYYGSLRNYYIGHKALVIRPYVQAFNLHVSYDRKYYGPAYVSNEIRGIHEGANMGYTFWNMLGQYEILKEALGTNN